MCSEPVMRAPASGLAAENSSRIAMRPGISVSAIWISLRPHAASARSATLKSVKSSGLMRAFMVVPLSLKGDLSGEKGAGLSSFSVSRSRINERRFGKFEPGAA